MVIQKNIINNPWKGFTFESDKFICPTDSKIVEDYNRGRKKENLLDLSLMPEPYIGDLGKCRLLILMANPGPGDQNHMEQNKLETHKSYVLKNLLQESNNWPFYPLHPDLRYEPVGKYWMERLSFFCEFIQENENLKFEKAIQEVANRVAVAEMHPYHSEKFNFSKKLLGMESSQFTHHLVNLAISRKCSVLVARGLSNWENLLEKMPESFLTLRSTQASGAIKDANLMKVVSLSDLDLSNMLEIVPDNMEQGKVETE